MIQPATIDEVQTVVRASTRLAIRGGGTKSALSTPANGATVVDLASLSGIVEYNPGEYTFTALAGTRVSEIQAALAEHGQYLPFDPPLVERGATLGGTVASGLSGPGRYRYGGVRDFILGVRFVDGRGEIVRGGGKVVKNSAGFDIPKLMVGSLGSLGVLVELTFKVFPRSPAHVTIRAEYKTLADALDSFYRLYTARIEIDSLDLVPRPDSVELLVRLAGLPEALPARAERIRNLVGGEVLAEDEAVWREAREFTWVNTGWTLIKVPLTPKRIPDLESRLGSMQTLRRYSAGNVGWVAVADSPENMGGLLASLALPGLVIIGATPNPRIGYRNGQTFESRIKLTFDPHNRFPNL